jgi:hypothetical protein
MRGARRIAPRQQRASLTPVACTRLPERRLRDQREGFGSGIRYI